MYEDANRIPTRNQRGTPEQVSNTVWLLLQLITDVQDALRRDLTIGALMLQVEVKQDGDLSFTLLDYFQGLPDLLPADGPGVLRSPFPHEVSSSQLRQEILTHPGDEDLAAAAGIQLGEPTEEKANCQVLWWIKVLRDDPLRALRALRFVAKLGFALDGSFWKAIPFALDALKVKVAGSRKLTEMSKISKLGHAKLQAFMLVAFDRRFTVASGQTACLAPALFGGNTPGKVAQFPNDVNDFDSEQFTRMLCAVPVAQHSGDDLFAEHLAAAFTASTFEADDQAAAAEDGEAQCAGSRSAQWGKACAGMSVPNTVCDTGDYILEVSEALSKCNDTQPLPHDAAMAEALTACGLDISAAQFALHVKVWLSLISPSGRHKRLTLPKGWDTTQQASHQDKLEKDAIDIVCNDLLVGHQRCELILALVREHCADAACRAQESMILLGGALPARLSGKSLGNGKGDDLLSKLPTHKRGEVLAWFEVCHRLVHPCGVGEVPAEEARAIVDPESLIKFAEANGDMLNCLVASMYVDGVLREEYDRKKPGTKGSNAKKKRIK